MEIVSHSDPGLDWTPAQDLPKFSADFREQVASKRGVKVGASSTANTTKTQPAVKRKREALDDAEEAADQQMEDASAPQPVRKQRKTVSRNVTGVASARPWKLPAQKRASAGPRCGKPWEVKACNSIFLCMSTLLSH